MAFVIVNQPANSAFAKSPILYNIWDNSGNVVFYFADIFIWNGPKATPPATFTYQLRKSPIEGDPSLNTVFDVGELIRSYIDGFDPERDDTASLTNDVGMWVLIEFGYYDTLGITHSAAATSNTVLVLDGFSKYTDGINYSFGDQGGFLTDVNDSIIEIGAGDRYTLSFIYDALWTKNFYLNGQTEGQSAVPILLSTLTLTQQVNQVLRTINVGPNEFGTLFGVTDPKEWFRVWMTDSGSATVSQDLYFKIVPICKHTPKQISFENRYGVQDYIRFFSETAEVLKADSVEYYRDTIDPNRSGLNFDVKNHQIKRLNVSGEKTFILNSGWFLEADNSLFEQLLLTERAWLWDDISGVAVPVLPVSKTISLKTSVRDKLINYAIEFKYAFNQINSVR